MILIVISQLLLTQHWLFSTDFDELLPWWFFRDYFSQQIFDLEFLVISGQLTTEVSSLDAFERLVPAAEAVWTGAFSFPARILP